MPVLPRPGAGLIVPSSIGRWSGVDARWPVPRRCVDGVTVFLVAESPAPTSGPPAAARWGPVTYRHLRSGFGTDLCQFTAHPIQHRGVADQIGMLDLMSQAPDRPAQEWVFLCEEP
jgi:hypothetical protein